MEEIKTNKRLKSKVDNALKLDIANQINNGSSIDEMSKKYGVSAKWIKTNIKLNKITDEVACDLFENKKSINNMSNNELRNAFHNNMIQAAYIGSEINLVTLKLIKKKLSESDLEDIDLFQDETILKNIKILADIGSKSNETAMKLHEVHKKNEQNNDQFNKFIEMIKEAQVFDVGSQ
jgi:hypothetical protein